MLNVQAHPILFSAPMVRALLEGRKTQTRRVIKEVAGWGPRVTDVVRSFGNGRYFTCAADGSHMSGDFPCPYGKPGDLLYVREAWRTPESLDHLSPSEIAQRCKEAGYHGPWCPIVTVADNTAHNWSEEDGFRDDEPSGRFRQGMHMPRWASRITLRVTDVRVERVQDMEGQHANGHDALAEGINAIHHGDGAYYYSAFRDEPHPKNWCDPTDAFRELWNSINEARGYGWDHNPWVWVICFEVIRANVDDVLAGRVAA